MNKIKEMPFPDPPKLQGKRRLISITPIMHSKELITIGTLIIDSESNFLVKRACEERMISDFFGDNSMNGIISLTVQSIESHLSNNESIEDWNPPLEGVFLSSPSDIADDSLELMAKQSLSMSSFIYRACCIKESKS